MTFDSALKKFPKEQRDAIMATIKEAERLFPHATRGIAWGMPTLILGEKDYLCHVSGFKNHNSLFPSSGSISEMLAQDLKGLTVSKGTIQFDAFKPFPKSLLKKVLLARLNQINDSYPKSTGEFREYYKNGALKSKGKIKGKNMHGAWEWFRLDGSLMRSGSFKDGEQSGTWKTYAANGRLVKETKF